MAKKGESTANDSKKLTQLFEKIDEVFDYGYHHGITPNIETVTVINKDTGEEEKVERSKRWSAGTPTTYSDMVKSFIRDINKDFGVSRVDKIFEKSEQYFQNRIDKYHDGKTSESYNLKTLTSAIHAFNYVVERCSVFSTPFKLADTDNFRTMMKEQHVIRHSGASTVMHATPDQSKSVLHNIRNSGYDTKMREIAYHTGKISMLTGGRISAILKLKAGDFVIDKSKNEIQFIGDKGGKDNVVKIDRETASYLNALQEGKKDGERIFSAVRTQGAGKGTFLSTKELRKSVERIVSQAGKHLKTTKQVTVRDKNGKPVQRTINQKFSPHSFRKSFALDRASYYIRKFDSRSALDKYVARRVAEDPKLKEKLDTLRDRINRDRNEPRELKTHEYAIFFTSVDLGHFRNDVITAFYTTYKEVEAYLSDSY